jgi:hypothetical protein
MTMCLDCLNIQLFMHALEEFQNWHTQALSANLCSTYHRTAHCRISHTVGCVDFHFPEIITNSPRSLHYSTSGKFCNRQRACASFEIPPLGDEQNGRV